MRFVEQVSFVNSWKCIGKFENLRFEGTRFFLLFACGVVVTLNVTARIAAGQFSATETSRKRRGLRYKHKHAQISCDLFFIVHAKKLEGSQMGFKDLADAHISIYKSESWFLPGSLFDRLKSSKTK